MKTSKTTLLTVLVTFLYLFPALTRAETAVQAWVQSYNGASAMAVDGSNNVIVTGNSGTVKYSSAGVPLWTNSYYQSRDQAIAVDGSNNVIVTGESYNSTNSDYLTIKYSSDGQPLWTNRYDSLWTNIFPPSVKSGDDCPYAVAVDHSNNVIVTGSSYFGDALEFYATIKYSSAGVPLWTNLYGGNYYAWDTMARAIAVDGNNNVLVTGWSAGEYVTIKYSSAGVPLWTNSYVEFFDQDGADAIAVDGCNNVIVTGGSAGYPYGYDFATIKYSSEGVPLWVNRYDGPWNNGVDYATALAVDHDNNVIVTGNSGTDYQDPNYFDYATVKYSSAGVPLWTNRYNGPGNGEDWPYAVAVDSSNNVIVTGSSTNSTSGYDSATIKYSSAGLTLWTMRYNGGGAGAVAVDHSDNVIVSGRLGLIKYICVPSPVLAALQLADGTVQLRVDGVLQPGTLVIEAATDLAGWAPVFTNTTPTNVLFYIDPEAGNYPGRFYRAFQFP